MTTPNELAQRRGKVRRMAQDGASNRAIAAQLGVSKDTVRRDLEWFDIPLAERLAQRATHAETAISHLSAAAQSVVDANPAHVMTDPETARRWYEELCATADRLTELAESFAGYYDFAQRATGGAP
jgi:IS30 family transposase